VTADDPARATAGRPLGGRVALVTGVSRRIGIGMAVVRCLAGLGADLVVTSWTAHDREQPWGADPGGLDAVMAGLRAGAGDLAGGRVVLVTSGQQLGPMPDELAYATSKGALVAITPTLADTLADRGITVSTVNPGPTDTGYADEAVRERVATRFPGGRWGAPDDVARLVAWLCTDEAAWVTGQVINSEGGFRRYS
jgi:3-oxoacyl-[acyl-carrier protein] reductase